MREGLESQERFDHMLVSNILHPKYQELSIPCAKKMCESLKSQERFDMCEQYFAPRYQEASPKLSMICAKNV